ncbi:phosphatidate cytidylyltransferase [Streptomyces qinzhouensis]|uniref:Phosphatidate cytidylyltransferase n=1 Tax=Streptomyces qinzhouensis TaxID=2599401 RepID=A0A5B8IL51_9ACTN|nr:phosphatidate cytidylyltransferase [Streptomyces qinzhouensis]QDY79258.1 phosphatidate cytidylyltransferase [Streptomyces qinzhouensis]
MNDASWGAPQRADYVGGWRPQDRGPLSAGPAYDGHDAQQTRPMPIVPDFPDAGRDAGGPGDRDRRNDSGRGAAEPGRPLFRDELPREPRPAGPQPPPAGGPGDSRGGEVPGAPDAAGGPGASGDRAAPAAGAPDAARPEKEKKRAGRDLRAAIGVGVGLGAVIVASLFVVKAVFVGVIAVAVVVGLWELTSRLQERKQIKAPLVPLAVGGAAMVVAGYVRGAEGAWVATALTALAVLVWRMTEPPEGYLKDVTAGVFAAFYVPFLATFVSMMLTADDGAQRVLIFLLLTVVSDTGAYAVGWRFGKRRLAPRISPGKTREGLFGAMGFAMVAGALCMQFLIDGGAWWQGILLGLAVAVTATLGDLGESMIKRDLGIKDMGTLLPGHGGIMDRLDSLLPTAPVVWLLLVVFVGA